MVKEKIKKVTRFVFKFVQNILLPIFLFLVYFIGFGIMFILTIFFKPNFIIDLKKNKSTFWNKVEDCNESIEDCENES